MRAASWESSAGALAAFLNAATQGYVIDLFTFTLSGGGVLTYTSADVDVTVNGVTYLADPTIKRGTTKLSVGISVDTLTVEFGADSSILINSTAMLPFVANGGFDGATMLLERAYAADPISAWVGKLALFTGTVSDTTVSRYGANLTIKSTSELLNVMIPRNLYQPACNNALFDSACGLLKSSYASSATATSVTDAALTTFSTGLAQASGYFALGFAVGLTGANAGVARTIKAFSGGAITTIQPWPAAVGVGDTFTVYPGCDKQQATCSGKFANLARFRGYPFIPAPETVL